MLQDMEEKGEDPGFEALDALVRAHHEAGVIDTHTLAMWEHRE